MDKDFSVVHLFSSIFKLPDFGVIDLYSSSENQQFLERKDDETIR